MDKTKLVPILFLTIITGLGFVAFRFYSENQNLIRENKMLKMERVNLTEKNNKLRTNKTGS